MTLFTFTNLGSLGPVDIWTHVNNFSEKLIKTQGRDAYFLSLSFAFIFFTKEFVHPSAIKMDT